MAFYESTFVAKPDISVAEMNKLIEQFSGIVTQEGGKVVKNEYWGLRNLAYLIKKSRRGHYAMLGIDASPEALNEMERNMRLHEDVIRHLTVRVEEIGENPSPMLLKAQKEEALAQEFGHDMGDPYDAEQI